MQPTTNHNTKNFETIKLLLDQAIIGTLKQYISLNESAKRRKGKEVNTTTDNSSQTASSGIVKSLKSQLVCSPCCSLSIRRFWGKGERWKRKRERAEGEELPFSSPPPPSPIENLLSPSPLGRSDTQATSV